MFFVVIQETREVEISVNKM